MIFRNAQDMGLVGGILACLTVPAETPAALAARGACSLLLSFDRVTDIARARNLLPGSYPAGFLRIGREKKNRTR